MPAPYCGIDCLLHDHVDGAFPIGAILPWLYIRNGKIVPRGVDLARVVRAKFLNPHADILEAFSHTTGLLQDNDTIYEAVKNHVVIRARQGIQYDELMLAPQYHLFGEFSNEAKLDPIKAMWRVIDSVVAGIQDGEATCPGIEANLIVAIGRELPWEKAIEVLKAVERSNRNYAVGWNLVCDESAFPPELHAKTFEYAESAEINTDMHASEWVRKPEQAPDFDRDLPILIGNLRTVMNMYMNSKSKTKKRIGHGIALPYAGDLMAVARDLGIGITGCPGSNLQGGNIPNLLALKIREMLKFGILWSMNPDDDFFQPNINETYQVCNDVYRFTPEDKQQMRRNAWLTRFGNRKPLPVDVVI